MRNMKITTTEKSKAFTGTPVDIVENLGAINFVERSDKFHYMKDVARRVEILTGTLIAHDDARTFLYGLQRAGLITVDFDAEVN